MLNIGSNAPQTYESGSILQPMSYARATRPLKLVDRMRVTGRLLYEPAYTTASMPVVMPITRLDLGDTRLAREMTLWEYWQGKFWMEYVPSVTFTTPGTLYMCGDTDIGDIPGKTLTPTMMMDQALSVSTPLIRGVTCPLPSVSKRLYTDMMDSGDARLHSPGYFTYLVLGSGMDYDEEPADASVHTSIGSFYLHYDVTFSVPSLNKVLTTSGITSLASTDFLLAQTTGNLVSATANEAVQANAPITAGRTVSYRTDPKFAALLRAGYTTDFLPQGVRYVMKAAGAAIDDAADTYTLLSDTAYVGLTTLLGSIAPISFSSLAAATQTLKSSYYL